MQRRRTHRPISCYTLRYVFSWPLQEARPDGVPSEVLNSVLVLGLAEIVAASLAS